MGSNRLTLYWQVSLAFKAIVKLAVLSCCRSLFHSLFFSLSLSLSLSLSGYFSLCDLVIL